MTGSITKQSFILKTILNLDNDATGNVISVHGFNKNVTDKKVSHKLKVVSKVERIKPCSYCFIFEYVGTGKKTLTT